MSSAVMCSSSAGRLPAGRRRGRLACRGDGESRGRSNVRASRPAGQYRGRPASVSIWLRGRERSGVRGTAALALRGSACAAVAGSRVGLPPRPGGADDLDDVAVSRPPAQDLLPARPASATRTGGSPARRSPMACGIAGRPRASAADTTSRTLKPPPFPRLMASAAAPPRVRPPPSSRIVRARSPRARARARGPGPRREGSRGCRSRRASDSRSRTPSSAAASLGRGEDVRDQVGLRVVDLAVRARRARRR